MGRSGQQNPRYTREFGRRVRSRREGLGLTQEGLGELAGLHWTYVGSIERGERNLSLLNVLRLAKALKVDPGELVGGLRI
jgi:transcriptional regulator with XRE-family HTH domain